MDTIEGKFDAADTDQMGGCNPPMPRPSTPDEATNAQRTQKSTIWLSLDKTPQNRP